jgi:hypothetical protein
MPLCNREQQFAFRKMARFRMAGPPCRTQMPYRVVDHGYTPLSPRSDKGQGFAAARATGASDLIKSSLDSLRSKSNRSLTAA